MSKVRVRFAPSPTGYLHIGGARTALFNWLFARHNKGIFILRIEDTDRSRSTEEYIEAIIDGMKWLGLDWDEGPYRQTERMDIYRSYVERLIEENKAYYCYCSAEELQQRRQQALKSGKTPKYDGRCRELKNPPSNRKPAVRFKMPQVGKTVVDDLIRGKVYYENQNLDDFIILRSDGTPTYNFVVVVDDVEMGITHVIRGDDHLNNTPKQIHIYEALNFNIPKFAHLPMILGPDKTRLSKRHGATSVQAYKEMGYLPEALLNYLVRLGWSYGDQEIFTKQELIDKFSIEGVGKSSAVFNPDKLLWLNSHYIKNTSTERIAEFLIPFLIKKGYLKKEDKESIDTLWFKKAIKSLQQRSRTLEEMANSMKYYLLEDIEIEPKIKNKFLNEKSKPYLNEILQKFISLNNYNENTIKQIFMDIVKRDNIKLSKIAQPVRVAVTGTTVGAGIFEVLDIIGKEKTIKRLKKAINEI